MKEQDEEKSRKEKEKPASKDETPQALDIHSILQKANLNTDKHLYGGEEEEDQAIYAQLSSQNTDQ